MSALFDRLAKVAAGGGSRRDALKRLAGFLAGGFLAAFPTKVSSHHHHHHHHDDDCHHHHEDPMRAAEVATLCLLYCQRCANVAGGVMDLCFEHCRRGLMRHPDGVLCGKCHALVPVTVCHGKRPICTPSGICL